jgi:hypothetical protein
MAGRLSAPRGETYSPSMYPPWHWMSFVTKDFSNGSSAMSSSKLNSCRSVATSWVIGLSTGLVMTEDGKTKHLVQSIWFFAPQHEYST